MSLLQRCEQRLNVATGLDVDASSSEPQLKPASVTSKLPNMSTYLIDIDGTVCEDVPNEHASRFMSASAIPGAAKAVCVSYSTVSKLMKFLIGR